jgi:hypothetical protein
VILAALYSFAACLPFAWLLIRVTPQLDGDATREINRIEDNAAEAQAWLAQMKDTRQ